MHALRWTVALLASLGLAPTAMEASLAPTKPSQLVTAFGATCISGSVAVNSQTGADGTLTPFSIPAGKVLIVTSGEITFDFGTAGASSIALLEVNGVRVVSTAATLDSDGRAFTSFQSPSGIPIKAGASVGTETFNSSGSACAGPILHGFLATDK